jgi:hypothetical protein
VSKELTKADFKPSVDELTHLLFLTKWEPSGNFMDPIVKAGKTYLEDKITP